MAGTKKGKKGKKENEAGSFAAAGHLAFSGFTHIGELGSLKFAVVRTGLQTTTKVGSQSPRA
jgi:hypothetical protein